MAEDNHSKCRRIDSHFTVPTELIENPATIGQLEDAKANDVAVALDTLAVTAQTKLKMPDSCRPVVPSISISTTYEVERPEDMDEYDKNGYVYGRDGNHSADNAAHAINRLEGGFGAIVFPTGMSAITTTIIALVKAGDHIIAPDSVYGGTFKFLSTKLLDFDVHTTFIPAGDIDAYRKAIKPNTKIFYGETPTNPTLSLLDLEAFAEVARSVPGAISMCDSTFASPYLQDTLAAGVDISMHSCTKYLGGHSDLLGGSICTKDPEIYLFMREYQAAIGNTMAPFTASLLLRGIRTLHVRMGRQCSNALKIAHFLKAHPKVTRVNYPGLPTHPQHALAQRQMPRGFGGMMSFELDGGLAAGNTLLKSVRLITCATSLGGTESLMQHPATMSHAVMTREERLKGGITDGLIRMSVGIEDADDLIRDLEQALAEVDKSSPL